MLGPKQYRPLQLLYRRILLAVLAVAVVFFARGVWDVYQKAQETHENRTETEAEYTELRDREEQLQAELAHLRTDRGIEAELRQQYEVAREGEHLLVIVEAEPPPEPEPEPRWKSWFSWWPF